MPCAKEPPLSDELREQFSILENSQGLIRSILLGIVMQYQALELQKCQLLERARTPQDTKAAACPEPKNIQIAASLIILNALFGFQKQAEGIACQTAQAGACPDWTEPKLNATVILVALVRLCRLISPENVVVSEGAASAAEQVIAAQEVLEEPVI